MKKDELQKLAEKMEGFECKITHTIREEENGKTNEEKLKGLIESYEFLLVRLIEVDEKDICDGFRKWLHDLCVIELYNAGVMEFTYEDNRGLETTFKIKTIYENEICEDF